MALFTTATLQSAKAPSIDVLLEAAGYPARVCRIIDLGLQPGSDKFPKPVNKLLVTFELLEEFMKEVDADGNPIMVPNPEFDADDEDCEEPAEIMKDLLDKPRWFDFEFTYNEDGFMGDGSHIYKFMKAVDALEVLPNPEQGIKGHPAVPLQEILGKPLVVGLITKLAKGGKHAGKYRNHVATFAPMKAKERKVARELINPTVFFDMGNPDLEVFNKLPGGDSPYTIKNKITNGPAFKQSKLFALLGGTQAPVPNQASEQEVDDALKAELAAQQAAKEARENEAGNEDADELF